jgi:superfamily I DNA/RNA helicase
VIAEEKRLFYVAISRPKSELYLLGEKSLKSDYIDQILKNDPDLTYSSILNQENNVSNNNMNINELIEDEIPF